MQQVIAARTIALGRLATVAGRYGSQVLLCLVVSACGDDDKATPDTSGQGDATSQGDVADISGDATATPDGDATGSSFCTSNTECASPGEICDCHGQCVVAGGKACTEDRNCGVPNWCNTCTGFCEAQVGVCETCSTSNSCLDQGACLPYASGDQFCGLGCVTEAGCPDGFVCLPVEGFSAKQCIAKSGTCDDLGLCARDTECPVGQICSDATRTCANGCVEDGQCQNQTLCVGGRCVPPCTGDADCTAPATCSGGKCKIPGACEVATDCPAPGTYCSRETGECATGCQIDADCKNAGQRCDGGSCVDKGCLHNFECAFGKVCDQASGQCVAFPASDPHCATCDAQAETNPTCPEPNLCASFQDQDEQPRGDFCLVPCKDDPIDRCPSGWQCIAIEDPESGAEQFFCARQCFIDPVGVTP